MGEKEIIEINKNGWNELVRSGKNYSNTSLPEYGPFMRNEEYFNIFSEKKQENFSENSPHIFFHLQHISNLTIHYQAH